MIPKFTKTALSEQEVLNKYDGFWYQNYHISKYFVVNTKWGVHVWKLQSNKYKWICAYESIKQWLESGNTII
jgi:hypothetical protein